MKNTTFKCAICGKEHETIKERIECESTCLRKQEEEARLAAKKKLEAEKAERKKEVDEAFDKAYELADKYSDDYGHYYYGERNGFMSINDFFNRLP